MTIAAKPTVFNDRHFRSRTEARWAAFLDSLNSDWEYEPQPVSGWMPDFGLRRKGEPFCYLEVKGSPEAAKASATENDARFHQIADQLKLPILMAHGPPAIWKSGHLTNFAAFHAWEPETETHRLWRWTECERCKWIGLCPRHQMGCECQHLYGPKLERAGSAMRNATLGDA